MIAGDTVTVSAGNYPERVQVNKSGTGSGRIIYQAQGAVTMKGFTIIANYITISGFDISNQIDDMTQGHGIHVQGSYNIFENNYIHDCSWGGIILYAPNGNTTLSTNDTIRNNRMVHDGQNGIEIQGRNHLVEGNDISGTYQRFPGVSVPTWADADGMRFFGSGHVIRGNYIHDIPYDSVYNINPHIDCFQTWGDTYDHEVVSNILIEQNDCRNMGAVSGVVQGSALTMEGNLSSGIPFSNVTVRNNLMETYGGIFVSNGINTVIVNNTIIGGKGPVYPEGGLGISLISGTVGTTIKNNIFLDDNPVYGSDTNLNAGYNNISMRDGTTPTGYVFPTSTDQWKVNPQFIDSASGVNGDYHLKSTSPCINAGTDLSSLGVVNDLEGNSRPIGGAYDMGAYEYGGVPGPSPSLFPTPSPVVSPSPVPSPSPLPSPSVLPGLSWQAEQGTLSSIFQIGTSGSVSYVFQSTKTDPNPLAGGLATYRFNIPQAGDYVIKTVVNAPDVDTNSFYVNIDAEPTHPGMIWDILPYTTGFAERTISWRGTGTQDADQYNPKVFTLTAGIHTLYIRGREANVQLDSLRIESNSPACIADLSGDKTVNLADIVAVLSKWGQTGTLTEDINGDGIVNLGDLQNILSLWGQGCS